MNKNTIIGVRIMQ
ncbi:unnamed protein product [Lathyrus oleraceus]